MGHAVLNLGACFWCFLSLDSLDLATRGEILPMRQLQLPVG